MKEYIHLVENPFAKDYNINFLSGAFDYTIEELVDTIMYELEADIENITIEDRTLIDELDEVDTNMHKININYKKKDLNFDVPKFKYISDGYYHELIYTIRIKTNLNEKVIEKRILIPVAIDGFYNINGKLAKMICQLSEASVYTKRGCIVLKSRMPISLYKSKPHTMTDIDGNEYDFCPYSFAMEIRGRRGKAAPKTTKNKNRFISPIQILAAKMGICDALALLCVSGCVSIVQSVKEKHKSEYTYFAFDALFIRVKTSVLNDQPYVRSIVGMLLYMRSPKHPISWTNLNNKRYWICRVGYIGVDDNNLGKFFEKGKTTMRMIERLLDDLTRNVIRVPMSHKENIYSIFRWLMVEFDNLIMKNNIDMNNKRIRRNEVLVRATLGKKLSENVNKLLPKLSNSRENSMDSLLELFNFSSAIIVNGMRNLNDIIKPDDMVNDLSILQDMAYTTKGPEALGETSTKNVPNRMRDIHPSFVGIVDLNCTSNSDIGLSGSFTPFVQLYDRFFFTPDTEPDDELYSIVKFIDEKRTDEDNIITEDDRKFIITSDGTVEAYDADNNISYHNTTPLIVSTKNEFNDSLLNLTKELDIKKDKINIIEKS